MNSQLDLKSYRPYNSLSYSGRPQGELVRKELNLSKFDKEDGEVFLIIPSDTTSFNPSFFLGLLFDSFKKLGPERFDQKYHFKILATDDLLHTAIKKNIEDGIRNALNTINKKTALSSFKN